MNGTVIIYSIIIECHIESKRISERKDLKTTIQKMIASDKPYFLEVKVEKEDNVFPMIPSGASVSEVRLK